MTDDETYNINKDMVWEQVGEINKILDDEKTTIPTVNYLTGMLRVWMCVIEEGASPPELMYKRK